MPTVIALAIGLIQPVKGGVIAFQWWHRMGGFQQRKTTGLGDTSGREAISLEEQVAGPTR